MKNAEVGKLFYQMVEKDMQSLSLDDFSSFEKTGLIGCYGTSLLLDEIELVLAALTLKYLEGKRAEFKVRLYKNCPISKENEQANPYFHYVNEGKFSYEVRLKLNIDIEEF